MKLIAIYTNLVLTTLLCSFATLAQDAGILRGTIKDVKSKEDIIGATILVQGINKGAATDINGFFSFSKLPVGTYSLKISFVGYQTKIYENVKVTANQVTELNLTLAEESTNLAEVKVVAQRLTNTEVSVISEIKAAQLVVSGISAAQITKTLDRTAAEVVKRVPGVTIFGDRFINIRGLNERYNSVQLNNTFAPSMETDVRSFSFDIIPAGQIDRILVFKSPSAELPGEFAGGTVKIFTKSIPEQNFLTFDYSNSFREGTTSKDFYTPQHGTNYWTGFNNGYFDLPKGFPANKSELLSSGAARLTQVGQSLKNNWVPLKESAMPDMRLSMSGGLKLNWGDVKIGNISSMNYSNSRTSFLMDRNDYGYSQIGSTGKPDFVFNFADKQYSSAIRFGAMHNWTFRFNDGFTLEFKNLFNQLSNSQYVDRTGIDNGANWNIKSFDQVYRGIYTGQLVGKHEWNDGLTKMDWVVGYNSSFRDQPDYKRFRYSLDGANATLLVPIGSAQTFNLGRTNIILNENAKTAALNFAHKFQWGKDANGDFSKELELKSGLYFETKNRSFSARNLGYVQSNSAMFNIGTLPIDQIFADQNINTTNGVKIDEQTNPNDSYTASNVLSAFYLSANFALGSKFNVVAGARAENNSQKLDSYDLIGHPLKYDNNVLNILPSINLSYNFTEKSLLRLAYGQTVNRPEFREVAPFSFYDFVNNRNISGNSNLKNATIQNFDLRFEKYPTPSEVMSLALFYKHFTNPIEVVFASGSNPNLSFENAESAYSAGIEAEIRKTLSPETPNSFLGRSSLVFNAAYILSKVKLNQSTSSNQSDNRPLQGQSPYILNASWNYNDAQKGLQVNLSFNVIGKRIYAVGNNYGYNYPDWYEMPRSILDLTFSKKIAKNVLIKGGISDLLNQQNYVLQDGNQDGKFDRVEDQVIQSYYPGRVYSLGLIFTPFGYK
ncbi:TonB-dependent receptor domain-containing protein [Aquirufa sp. ROCK-SH2]